MSKILHGDSLEVLKTLEDESVDVMVTDPPYGYGFMGKAWDKALPDIGFFKETLRVLKPGAFAFVMSAPRSDVCSRMAILLEDAGFNIAFTPIYWTYASGFPKAMNIGKMVDKRGGVSVAWFGKWLREWREENGITQKEVAALFPSKTGGLTGCVANWELGLNIATPEQFTKICRHFNLPFESLEAAEREVVGKQAYTVPTEVYQVGQEKEGTRAESLVTAPKTDAAKALDGSYGGFQPKPAVEVIIVAMKPLSEKTYVDQALKNGKGITWLDKCRVPTSENLSTGFYPGEDAMGNAKGAAVRGERKSVDNIQGRFPANLLVSDDVLNDHSRFFSVDEWAQTLPFLAVPKASKSEKNAGLQDREGVTVGDGRPVPIDNAFQRGKTERKNSHPTVKPLKLMSYLITLGSRPGDVVLDPFLGSGTTAIAAKELGRQFIGIERESEYVEIAEARLASVPNSLL